MHDLRCILCLCGCRPHAHLTALLVQVEADIRAFRGILLGLFFVTTGASINLQLLLEQWPVVFALVLGLLGIKSLLISVTGPLFGLTKYALCHALSQHGISTRGGCHHSCV